MSPTTKGSTAYLEAVPAPQVAAASAATARRPLPRGRVRILVAADLTALAVATALTYALAALLAPPAVSGPTPLVAGLIAAGWLGWVAILLAYKLYEGETNSIRQASLDEVGQLFHALLAGNLAYLLLSQAFARVTDVHAYTALEAALFLMFALVLVPAARGCVRSWLRPALMRPRRTLIVGADREGRLVQRKLASHPEYGLEVVGFVDAAGTRGDDIVGRPEDLTRLVDELEVDWVVLASARTPHEETLSAVRAVRRPDVHLSIVPSYGELFASNATLEDLEGMPLVSLPSMRLSRSVRALKRGVDIVGAGLGLLVLSPLLAAIALAIRLDSSGPVIFRQQRRGRAGTTFRIAKFRTMRDGAELERFDLAEHNELGTGPLFKIKSDPRITRIGSFLRRYSLDELPQLWNVVRGDMSLVGPRPFVIHEANQITGWAQRRLDITPGITGLWQVSGRNDMPFDEMVKLDYVYVTNWSLWWDVKILFLTIPVVIAKRGAY